MPNRTGRHRRMRQHARERAIERFGVELKEPERTQIIADIQSGRAIPVHKISKRCKVFLVEFDERPCKVLYDSHRHEIATVINMQTGWKNIPQSVKYRYEAYVLQRKIAYMSGVEKYERCVTG